MKWEQKKGKKSKGILFLTAAAVLLAGCGEKEKEESSTPTINKEAVYREEEFLEGFQQNISSVLMVGENLYIDQILYSWETVEPRMEEAEEDNFEEIDAEASFAAGEIEFKGEDSDEMPQEDYDTLLEDDEFDDEDDYDDDYDDLEDSENDFREEV